MFHQFRRASHKRFVTTFKDNLTAKAARLRPDVNDVVRSLHDFFIVFYNDYRVSQLLKVPKNANQFVGVCRMEANAGFVQNVKCANQAASQ